MGESLKRPSILSKLGSTEPAIDTPQLHSVASQPRQRVVSTAITGLSRSLDDLTADSVTTLDAGLIDPSPFGDRLEQDQEAFNLLVASIEAEGQKIPVLVRPHPEKDGRYQLAYGHRRLQALKSLDRKVRAFIRPLTDAELILEQGAENGGREALTWIERALFAKEMEAQGLTSKAVWTTLGVDRTGLSKMRSVVEAVPRDIIRAIGRAPGVGQPRWQDLASAFSTEGAIDRASTVIARTTFASMASDQRFLAVLKALDEGRRASATYVERKEITSSTGKQIAYVSWTAKGHTFAIHKSESQFSTWLTENLPDLYKRFQEGSASEPPDVAISQH
ncbi:plasmid partitioning protein RepB (plasmid) [Methylosinus sp. 3S-1]|uniref:Plasmid partitioning protein RepB n=1 Tax=Methylosinus trichosporium (strain ATCC 35070 / NCIMB 11131 / UNIQEM 75 / OB3b) TaxID=595536 RepID=A0A2D2D7K4_METT3|nr:plasmid partitioning protein RepB [Methylosinus trichosporium OB3b]OBS54391.1 plasmid partitioning protein RepB [Methylosinus sp. 3S-1]